MAKLPKLKYYYHALKESDYQEFERTRQLLVKQPARIDIATGRVTESPPFLFLYSKPTVADTRYRQVNGWPHSVYVLRIPAALIPRRMLSAQDDPEGMWLCGANLSIEHCGVERFEFQVVPQGKIFASSKRAA